MTRAEAPLVADKNNWQPIARQLEFAANPEVLMDLGDKVWSWGKAPEARFWFRQFLEQNPQRVRLLPHPCLCFAIRAFYGNPTPEEAAAATRYWDHRYHAVTEISHIVLSAKDRLTQEEQLGYARKARRILGTSADDYNEHGLVELVGEFEGAAAIPWLRRQVKRFLGAPTGGEALFYLAKFDPEKAIRTLFDILKTTKKTYVHGRFWLLAHLVDHLETIKKPSQLQTMADLIIELNDLSAREDLSESDKGLYADWCADWIEEQKLRLATLAKGLPANYSQLDQLKGILG